MFARVWKCAVREFIERNECEICSVNRKLLKVTFYPVSEINRPTPLAFPSPPSPSLQSQGEFLRLTAAVKAEKLPSTCPPFAASAVIDRLPFFFFKSDLVPPRSLLSLRLIHADMRGQRRGTWTSLGADEFHFSLPFLILSRGIQWKTRFCRKKEGERERE